MNGGLVGRIREVCENPVYMRFLTEHRRLPGLPPIVTQEEFYDTEGALEFALPPVLKNIYTNVANGGFGPGFGLVGVRRKSGSKSDWWPNGGVLAFLGSEYILYPKPLVEVDGVAGYMVQHPEEENERLFRAHGLVQLCWNEPFGDEGTVSYVHCLLPGYPIIRVDPFEYDNLVSEIPSDKKFPGSHLMGASYVEAETIEAWLWDWVNSIEERIKRSHIS